MTEEEVSSSSTSAQQSIQTSLADGVKDQLQDMLALLDKNIAELIQDARSTRNIFQTIRSQLPPELELAIIPIAFNECHQLQVLQAKQRLSDRSAQQGKIEQREAGRRDVAELKRQIDTLVEALAQIDQEINRLKARELEDVRAAIKDEEQKMNQLPETVGKIREEMALKIHQTKTLHQSIKPILGTVEEDNRLIDEIDQIRLCAVNVIQ